MKKSFVILLGLLFLLSGRAAAQTVVFEDEFKNNQNNWQEGKTAVSNVRVVPGREMYQVQHKSKAAYDAWTAWTSVDIDEQKNFRITALLYKEGGVKNYGYGILWGGEIDNYYSFLVSPGGFYCVGKVVDGDWQDLTPGGWIQSGIVNQGRKAFNKLAVSKIGNTYHFAINDREIATMKCGPFFGNKIGFNVNNKQKIMVDWIKVEYLN